MQQQGTQSCCRIRRLLVRPTTHSGVQLLRSLIASTAASLADYSVLVMLVRLAGMQETAAGTISMTAGLGVVYVLGRCWVFPAIPRGYRRIEFSLFVAIAAIGAMLHVGVLATAVEYAGLHYLSAKAVAMAATFSWNFLMRRGVARAILRRNPGRRALVLRNPR